MSLGTWKKEFYPILASKVLEVDAVAHSLQKWRGLTEENLKKHELEVDHTGNICDKGTAEFVINSESCALCIHYYKEEEEENDLCVNCPLYKTLGHPCDAYTGSPYSVWTHTENPKPMIDALEETLGKY